MLDLKFVRENPDIVKQNIKNKFQDKKIPLVDEVIELDAKNRAAKKEADDLRANKNKIAKQIGALMGQGKKEEAETAKSRVAELKEVNKTLQTEAADAFLSMQAAAAKDGVDVRMQSGYRSVSYQKKLYDNKTQYYRDKGLSEAAAREKAAVIVNPPGCSEHNCGLAADLNSPEHTTLDTGFADTAAFRWLCENAEQYGFILRYPKEAESVTGITYEPWHWRYVGAENAALLNQSGLCLEDAVAVLQRIAAGETVTG